MARSKNQQSKHDALVRKIAKGFQAKGFDVQADVRGFAKPNTIQGYRPDVVAKKGAATQIVEVETPSSVDTARDQAQQKAFRAAAARSRNTTFQRKVTE